MMGLSVRFWGNAEGLLLNKLVSLNQNSYATRELVDEYSGCFDSPNILPLISLSSFECPAVQDDDQLDIL